MKLKPPDLEKMCAAVREMERDRIQNMLLRYGHAAAASLVSKKEHVGSAGDSIGWDESNSLIPSRLR